MSEAAPEETEQEVEETEEEPEETGEGEQETAPPADDAAKLKRALERERKAKRKLQADLAEARKGSDLGEADALKKQVGDLTSKIAVNEAVLALVDAGFNGGRASAQKMTKLMDLDDVEASIEELKEDFPERFGKAKQPPGGPRPHTGGGRDESSGKSKTPEQRFADRLMASARRT